MENKESYSPREVANIVDTATVYWERGEAHNRALLQDNQYELSLKAINLLESVGQMKKIPKEVRDHLTIAQADNKTLEGLEKIFKKETQY